MIITVIIINQLQISLGFAKVGAQRRVYTVCNALVSEQPSACRTESCPSVLIQVLLSAQAAQGDLDAKVLLTGS